MPGKKEEKNKDNKKRRWLRFPKIQWKWVKIVALFVVLMGAIYYAPEIIPEIKWLYPSTSGTGEVVTAVHPNPAPSATVIVIVVPNEEERRLDQVDVYTSYFGLLVGGGAISVLLLIGVGCFYLLKWELLRRGMYLAFDAFMTIAGREIVFTLPDLSRFKRRITPQAPSPPQAVPASQPPAANPPAPVSPPGLQQTQAAPIRLLIREQSTVLAAAASILPSSRTKKWWDRLMNTLGVTDPSDEQYLLLAFKRAGFEIYTPPKRPRQVKPADAGAAAPASVVEPAADEVDAPPPADAAEPAAAQTTAQQAAQPALSGATPVATAVTTAAPAPVEIKEPPKAPEPPPRKYTDRYDPETKINMRDLALTCAKEVIDFNVEFNGRLISKHFAQYSEVERGEILAMIKSRNLTKQGKRSDSQYLDEVRRAIQDVGRKYEDE